MYEQLKDRDWLYRLYWEDGLSGRGIAEILGCTQRSVTKAMKRLDVPRRQANRDMATENRGIRGLWNEYSKGAKRRGIQWGLSRTDFYNLILSPCHYCGAESSRIFPTGPDGYKLNGVDRKDSAKDYTPDNCVPCCTRCNYLKGSVTKEEFLATIDAIYRHSIGLK